MEEPAAGRIQSESGFTLIELMLAVAITGVLASLAVPTYVDFIEKARIARTIAELHGLAKELQGFALTNEQYPDTLTQIGRGTSRDPWGNLYQYYRINCGAAVFGLLDDPERPTGSSAGLVLPVNRSASTTTAHAFLAIDDGNHQGLVHLIQGGGGAGGGGPPCGGVGGARKDRFLVPINSDFDLYSMGKDGQSVAPLTAQKSHDDVIRASDGAFYGLAAYF